MLQRLDLKPTIHCWPVCPLWRLVTRLFVNLSGALPGLFLQLKCKSLSFRLHLCPLSLLLFHLFQLFFLFGHFDYCDRNAWTRGVRDRPGGRTATLLCFDMIATRQTPWLGRGILGGWRRDKRHWIVWRRSRVIAREYRDMTFTYRWFTRYVNEELRLPRIGDLFNFRYTSHYGCGCVRRRNEVDTDTPDGGFIRIGRLFR